MKKIMLIISAALAGIIVFQYLFYSCESGKKDKEIVQLQEQLLACVNAPEQIRTDTITHIIKDTIYSKSTYRVLDTVSDTVSSREPLTIKEYKGVFYHPQFEAHWRAVVTGTLDTMSITPPSIIKSLVITKEKTVPLALSDAPQSTIKEKSHLYATLGSSFNMRQINSIDAGVMYIRKEGWGIQAGIGTDFSYLLYRAGLIVKLK